MNTLFWRDIRNKNLTTYDKLVEMMRSKKVSEEMIDHQNRTTQGLSPPQRQMERGLAFYLVSQQ